MNLATVIMAHESRAEWVDSLCDRLDCDPVVVWDEYRHMWETAKRCLDVGRDADAVLVIQDDAVVCRDLCATVGAIWTRTGPRVVSAYLGMFRPRSERFWPITQAATATGSVMIEMDGPWWGVATVYPSSHIDELVAFGDAWSQPTHSYDQRTTAYYRTQRREKIVYPWPSLVDHRDDVSLHARGRKGGEGRVAFEFIGEDRSGLDVDWSGPIQTDDPSRVSPVVTMRAKENGKTRRVPFGKTQWRRMVADGRWEQIDEPRYLRT